jgi:hypothetical protein
VAHADLLLLLLLLRGRLICRTLEQNNLTLGGVELLLAGAKKSLCLGCTKVEE